MLILKGKLLYKKSSCCKSTVIDYGISSRYHQYTCCKCGKLTMPISNLLNSKGE